jgi:hypothetical protein
MESWKIERCIFGELSLCSLATVLAAVNPRPDDQPLQAFLGFSQLHEI